MPWRTRSSRVSCLSCRLWLALSLSLSHTLAPWLWLSLSVSCSAFDCLPLRVLPVNWRISPGKTFYTLHFNHHCFVYTHTHTQAHTLMWVCAALMSLPSACVCVLLLFSHLMPSRPQTAEMDTSLSRANSVICVAATAAAPHTVGSEMCRTQRIERLYTHSP